MKIVLFGATGMIGQGVLRACLSSSEVEGVLLVARSSSGVNDLRIHELIHQDMAQYQGCEDTFKGYDACFFCLGVSSVGMQANEYERITYGFTTAAASALAEVDPGMTFIYISGAGTDSSEKGRSRGARVKGKTENAVLAMPFKAAYMLRPGLSCPLRACIRSGRSLEFVNDETLTEYQETVRKVMAGFTSISAMSGEASEAAEVIYRTEQLRYVSGTDATALLSQRKAQDDDTFYKASVRSLASSGLRIQANEAA